MGTITFRSIYDYTIYDYTIYDYTVYDYTIYDLRATTACERVSVSFLSSLHLFPDSYALTR